MQNGVPILGKVTKRCKVQKESTFVFTITLVQGLNRQIRRMCEYFGYEVTQLIRTRIMNVPLKGLALGDWRDLSPKEIDTIIALTERSEAAPEGKSKSKPKLERPNYSSGSGKTKSPVAKGRQKPAKAGVKSAGTKAASAKPLPKGKKAASGKIASGPKGSAPGKPGVKGKSAMGKAGAKPAGKGRVGRGKPVGGKPSARRK